MVEEVMNIENGQLAGDLLAGAGAIAEFLFGDAEERRKVYALHDKGALPIFKLGEILHARKSALRRSLEEKEAAAVGRVSA
jgi:hypothetical protein